MWENVKAITKWVWNWITVLVVTILGVLSEVIQYIDQLTGLDWSPYVSKERMAMMIFWTAVTKTLVSMYDSIKNKAK